MSAFDIAGGAASGVLVVLIARFLLAVPKRGTKLARFGLAITGGAIVLTLAERLYPGSPFADWAFVMLRVGLIFYLAALFRSGGQDRPQPGGEV